MSNSPFLLVLQVYLGRRFRAFDPGAGKKKKKKKDPRLKRERGSPVSTRPWPVHVNLAMMLNHEDSELLG